jgi:hypothetical protein
MHKFGLCGRNDLKFLLAFASKRGKIGSGLHSVIYRSACKNACHRLLPVYSLRNVTFASNTDSGKYSEDLRKRNVTLMLLSSGLAVLALCSARQDGMFHTFGGGNGFLCYLSLI